MFHKQINMLHTKEHWFFYICIGLGVEADAKEGRLRDWNNEKGQDELYSTLYSMMYFLKNGP